MEKKWKKCVTFFAHNNNLNVREAIVRPKGDKNFFQQHLRVRKKNNKNSHKKTTKTISRLEAKTTLTNNEISIFV